MTPKEFSTQSQTYIENWPTGLVNLSIDQQRITLCQDEVRAIGQQIRGFEHWFVGTIASLDNLIHKLDAAIKSFPNGAFVRLGSRSAKDSYQALFRGLRVNNAHFALDLLSSKSKRIAFDLYFALRYGYEPSIYIRQWLEIPRWSEFRCFMQNRQLVGISQYDCINLGRSPHIINNKASIKTAIHNFFSKEFKHQCHIDDVVFDVFLETWQGELSHPIKVKLLELNPSCPISDACLFSWEKANDFDGSFRTMQ